MFFARHARVSSAKISGEYEPALRSGSCRFSHIFLDGSVQFHAHWHGQSTMAVLWPISTFILAAVFLEAPA
jgi:hypothetical protein